MREVRAVVAQLVTDDVEGETRPFERPRVQAVVSRGVVLQLLGVAVRVALESRF